MEEAKINKMGNQALFFSKGSTKITVVGYFGYIYTQNSPKMLIFPDFQIYSQNLLALYNGH